MGWASDEFSCSRNKPPHSARNNAIAKRNRILLAEAMELRGPEPSATPLSAQIAKTADTEMAQIFPRALAKDFEASAAVVTTPVTIVRTNAIKVASAGFILASRGRPNGQGKRLAESQSA